MLLMIVLGVWAQDGAADLTGTAWGSILQGGAIAVILASALYLIVKSGVLRPEREVKERDERITKLEVDCEKDLATQRADFLARLADQRADYEARLEAQHTAHLAREAELAAKTEQWQTLFFDLLGPLKGLADVIGRKATGEPP